MGGVVSAISLWAELCRAPPFERGGRQATKRTSDKIFLLENTKYKSDGRMAVGAWFTQPPPSKVIQGKSSIRRTEVGKRIWSLGWTPVAAMRRDADGCGCQPTVPFA
ncbi:hypothetical protein J6590_106708 [Homalodisca vitripennis]|nr:hypothetical protein J6590_106708 [Homalodisca vitripennis]